MDDVPPPATSPALPPELNPRGRTAGRRSGGAAPGGGARRAGRGLRRVAATIPAALGLVVLLGSGGAWVYVNQQFGNIKKIGSLCLAGCDGNPAPSDSGGNYLLVGSDTRAGANSTGNLKGVAEPNGAGGGYGNSDTTLLVHVPKDHQHITVVSFPRDMKVALPAYTDKQGKKHSGFDAKFNAAFSLGGPALLVKQVSRVSGLPVDHYVGIDFEGFQKMVDAVGGVQVCLSVPAYDPGGDGSGGSGFKSPAGRFTLNGERALQFVRQRHGLPGGDLDRIGRQQRFLSDLGAKVKSAGTLLDPLRLDNFLSAVTDSVTIDGSTSKSDLLRLAEALRNLDPQRVTFVTVPTTPGQSSPGLGAYLTEDVVAARAIFDSVRADLPVPGAVSRAPAPAADAAVPVPSSITLRVENGSGVPGQAAQAAAALQNKGFHVSGTSTRRGAAVAAPQVRYGARALAQAKVVAAAAPGAVLVADATMAPDAVVLVTATAAARPNAGATRTRAPAPPTAAAAPPAVPALASDCGP